MRIVGLLLLGTLVACAGEVAPDNAGKTTAPQSADPSKPVFGESRPVAMSEGTPRPNEYSEEACWDYGAAADGECTVGESQFCDGYTEMTAAGDYIVMKQGSYCKQLCVNDNGKAVWSEKVTERACAFFDSKWHVAKPGCSCEDKAAADQKAFTQSSSTPLVLSFDGAPVTFNAATGGAFDLVADGQCHGSDWPSAATPWLALDRDGNGAIDDGSELFGSAVRLANGARAKNGFEALRELDANHDGVFDAQDEAFARVVVWTDRNADRRSTPNELTSLAEAGVKAISLADRRDDRCDARGNCEGERSLFTMTTGQRGTVIDVYLKTR